jgi:hypothetical protein
MNAVQQFDDVHSYEELERKREETMLDPKYQQWVQELHISQSYVEPSGFIRVKEINSQYDYSGTTSKSSILNLLNIKGIWS